MSGEARNDRPLALVVVNYGSSDLLAMNLARSASESRADHVVVVDNPTTEPERRSVRELAGDAGWHLIEPVANLGFGGGVNAGVAAAIALGAQDILLLNPDAFLLDGCTGRLREAAADHNTVCAPHVVTGAGATWFAGADLYLNDGTTRGRARRELYPGAVRWEWLSGACLWIPIEVWSKTSGFDDEYFLYWEDVDFSRRVVNAGAHLAVVEEAGAVHDEGGTQGRVAQSQTKSESYYYFNIRNRMLFAAKNLDDETVQRWRRGIVRSAREVLLRGGRKQFLRSVVPWRAGLRGILAARRVSGSGNRT